MNKMYQKGSFAITLLLFVFGSNAQNLKLSIVKGQKFEVTTKTQINSTFSVMGQDMENTVSNSSTQAIEVKDTRATETDLTTTTTKLVSNMQSMGQEMNYDSDKKDNVGPLAESMDKIVGKVKNMTIDVSGKVIKEDKDEVETGMSAMLGSGTISGTALLQQVMIGKDIKKGASWPDSVSNNGEKIKSVTVGVYTVSAIDNEKHTATILFTGKQNSSGTIEQMGQEMSMTSSNKIDSQYEIDINTGLIIQSSIKLNGNSTVEAQGMSIPVTMISTVTTNVKRL